MFLRDDNNELVDSEFSLDVLADAQCVIVASSGGANPARDVVRRNPDYNKLVGLLLQRLAKAGVRLTAVVLDSRRVVELPVNERTVTFEQSYPIDLSLVDIEDLRRSLGRAVSMMHRDPAAIKGGNAQKRIRLCLDRPVSPNQLITNGGDCEPDGEEYMPGLLETERRYIRKARIGQGQFRQDLLAAFRSTCPIRGISHPDLLVASHIKPWTACTNEERLDPENGILLSALCDKLFDRGLMTFSPDGRVRLSGRLTSEDREKCDLLQLPVVVLPAASERYMRYHRLCVFQGD